LPWQALQASVPLFQAALIVIGIDVVRTETPLLWQYVDAHDPYASPGAGVPV
jgi:hypothetical protein